MPSWSNWSGKQRANIAQLHFLRSEEDAQALVQRISQDRGQLRVAGATHSHSPLLVNPDGVIADLRGLTGVVSADRASLSAWVWGGSRIYALGRALAEHGMALHNQGDIDEQAIAGATATGTHGTGARLKNLSSAVIGARIVRADGEVVCCDAHEHSDIWQAARLHLGALGVITQLRLALKPIYKLREKAWQAPLAEILEQAREHTTGNRHFEFFWFPQTDTANVKTINETNDAPEYPIASEGERCAWSHEVLPNHRPHRHTEMEYSVPAEQGPACMLAIQALLHKRFPEIVWPVEYRSVAGDDVWLSPAMGRPTVTISVHQAIELDDEPYFRACEDIFLAHDGRPHWGKVNYLTGQQLAQRHEHWQDWWRVRDQLDPNGIFLNPYLKGLRDTH